MISKIDTAKRGLALFVAICIAIVLFSFSSCTTTKKIISKESYSKDSTVSEKSESSTTATAEIKADVVSKEESTKETESGYSTLKIDSGVHVIIPQGKGKAPKEMTTTKPTVIILPNKKTKEKKGVVKKDQTISTKKKEVANVGERTVKLKTQDVAITRDIKKTRFSFWWWIIPLIIIGYYLNKRFKIIAKLKAFILTIIP